MDSDVISRSKLFAKRCSALSDQIAQVEAFLSELPGRVETTTKMGNGQSLKWARHEGQWRLLVAGHCCKEIPLLNATVAVKANAAKFLTTFLDDIATRLAEDTATIETALGAMALLANKPPAVVAE